MRVTDWLREIFNKLTTNNPHYGNDNLIQIKLCGFDTILKQYQKRPSFSLLQQIVSGPRPNSWEPFPVFLESLGDFFRFFESLEETLFRIHSVDVEVEQGSAEGSEESFVVVDGRSQESLKFWVRAKIQAAGKVRGSRQGT